MFICIIPNMSIDMPAPNVLLVNGPNLNRLGLRDPSVYGTKTLREIVVGLEEQARESGWQMFSTQSNHEGHLIDWIQEHQDSADALILNPAGLTDCGSSLRDCIHDAALPTAVVHISNLYSRPPPWRRTDIFAPLATCYIAGCGPEGYGYALAHLLRSARS